MKPADNFDLKKFITENKLSSVNEENPDNGLITFDQLKQSVEKLYAEVLDNIPDDEEDVDNDGSYGSYFVTATDIDELVDTLDELGFNGIEAYDFIFDSILK